MTFNTICLRKKGGKAFPRYSGSFKQVFDQPCLARIHEISVLFQESQPRISNKLPVG
jgi:hypothetical protein